MLISYYGKTLVATRGLYSLFEGFKYSYLWNFLAQSKPKQHLHHKLLIKESNEISR